MPRTPLGSVPQDDSRTALFAYFAARLEGVPVAEFASFFKELGITVGPAAAMRAMRPLRRQSPHKRLPGRPTAAGGSSQGPSVFREWLLIEELRLDLEVAFVQFPGDCGRQSDLIEALRTIPGVRQLVELQQDRTVVALLLFSGSEQRTDLRSRLEEIAPRFFWDDVIFETHEPARQAWRELARRAAQVERYTANRA
jgi:hypothetical protein